MDVKLLRNEWLLVEGAHTDTHTDTRTHARAHTLKFHATYDTAALLACVTDMSFSLVSTNVLVEQNFMRTSSPAPAGVGRVRPAGPIRAVLRMMVDCLDDACIERDESENGDSDGEPSTRMLTILAALVDLLSRELREAEVAHANINAVSFATRAQAVRKFTRAHT